MKQSLRQIAPLLIIALLSIPLFFIGIHDTHPWGDDYAQYIKEAENIAKGRPYYQSGYIFNSLNPEYAPPSYPPGFPLMLAPLVKFYGIAIRPMLYLVALQLCALMFILYFYFRKHMGVITALCLAVSGVYCAAIMDMKVYVLSDIPSVLFVSLYILLRQHPVIPIRRVVVLAAVAAFAVMLRTQNGLIIAAEAFVFIAALVGGWRRGTFLTGAMLRHPSLQIITGFLILYVPLMTLAFPAPSGSASFYLNFLNMYHGNFWGQVAFNFNYLNDLLQRIFYFETEKQFVEGFLTLVSRTSFVFALLGFLISLRRKPAVEEYFFLLMCLLLLVLPVHQGLRYLLPLVPVFLLYVYRTARLLLPVATGLPGAAMAVALTIAYVLSSIPHYRDLSAAQDWTPYGQQDSAAFAYLRTKVAGDEIIAFSKPRALTLYTGRRAIAIAWQASPEENRRVFDSLKVKYLLRRADVEEDQVEKYIGRIPPASEPQIIAAGYTLYPLR